MDEKDKQASVPYFVHEGQMARMERIFRLTVVALIVALAVSAVSFVINDSQWREYCRELEARYSSEVDDARVHEQPNP